MRVSRYPMKQRFHTSQTGSDSGPLSRRFFTSVLAEVGWWFGYTEEPPGFICFNRRFLAHPGHQKPNKNTYSLILCTYQCMLFGKHVTSKCMFFCWPPHCASFIILQASTLTLLQIDEESGYVGCSFHGPQWFLILTSGTTALRQFLKHCINFRGWILS